MPGNWSSDVTHLARTHQIVKRPHGLVNRRMCIDEVSLIKVDHVGLKASQTVFNGALDVVARQPLIIDGRPHGPPALGRKENFIPHPAIFHPSTDDRFGVAGLVRAAAKRVDVGGIEKIEARLIGFVENCERGLLV